MRITGGTLKGRTFPVPVGIIRPAMERMRESVFAVLGDLTGASFLDFFSGSGIIAMEAASRGAVYLETVESDKHKRKTLLDNTAFSPVRIHCRFMPVELYIRRARRSFDFIFCDPPFTHQYKTELLDRIGTSPLMNNTSLLMIHRPKKEQFMKQIVQENLLLKETRYYGNSAVDFFLKFPPDFQNIKKT
ncbi:MAG: RsmD family RNA methyltransferase [Treponema sp.]|nr:RsmD family RNA methyltransferase [Treponema sp.]